MVQKIPTKLKHPYFTPQTAGQRIFRPFFQQHSKWLFPKFSYLKFSIPFWLMVDLHRKESVAILFFIWMIPIWTSLQKILFLPIQNLGVPQTKTSTPEQFKSRRNFLSSTFPVGPLRGACPLVRDAKSIPPQTIMLI